MMTEKELNEFLKKKKQMCESHVNCQGCLLRINTGTIHCAAKHGEVTQWQMNATMSWQPPVDWDSVPVNTKVVVWRDGFPRHNRYFAKYEYGRICTFPNGATSWSKELVPLEDWKYGELVTEDE